jgi:hypothetical protein
VGNVIWRIQSSKTSLHDGRLLDKGVFALQTGSIDSLASRELALAGFVDVARLPPAPFRRRLTAFSIFGSRFSTALDRSSGSQTIDLTIYNLTIIFGA